MVPGRMTGRRGSVCIWTEDDVGRQGKAEKRRRVSWREDEEGSEGVYGRVLSVQDDDIR